MSDATTLRQKINDWTDRLEGDDPHSIVRQVTTMLWRSAFYRAVNDSRKHLPEDRDGKLRGNGTLHRMLTMGYVTMHASDVRRLMDGGPTSGKYGVNSLYNLIQDIRAHGALLTRANVLAARGYDYEYEQTRREAEQRAEAEAIARGETGYIVSGEGWFDSEYWHMTWDELCGVTETSRSPDDRPHDDRFGQLLAELRDQANDVCEYVNKHIAHPASADSRASLTLEQQSLNLDKLWRSERAMACAACFVGRGFGSGSFPCNVPAPQFNVFKYLDEPFATPEGLAAMRAAWRTHDREIERCACWNWTKPLGDS